MRLPIILVGVVAIACGACAKSPSEPRVTDRTPLEPQKATPTLADIATKPQDPNPPNVGPDPHALPSAEPTAPPDAIDHRGPEGTGLPSSRVDGGGAPRPLPPGVTIDAGRL